MIDGDNLHRALAPISSAAWDEIARDVTRTFRRHVAGRRVFDVMGPHGIGFSAVPTGHTTELTSFADGVNVRQRVVAPLVELTVEFELDRAQIDDVVRGSVDSDWQPAKEAAARLAHAEDTLAFTGYTAAGVRGLGPSSNQAPVPLPHDATLMPQAIATAQSQLRLAGVDGPYSLILDDPAYRDVTEKRDSGFPILRQLEGQLDGSIIWAPAITGGYLLSTRGGDFELTLGQDVSIGYLRHTDRAVHLYLRESVTARTLTSEAVVVLPR